MYNLPLPPPTPQGHSATTDFRGQGSSLPLYVAQISDLENQHNDTDHLKL